MAMLGAICGSDGWDDIVDFAEVREAWLRSFLERPNGMPSPDTFRLEERRVWTSSDLDWMSERKRHQNLPSLVMVERERQTASGNSTERAYFLSCRPSSETTPG